MGRFPTVVCVFISATNLLMDPCVRKTSSGPEKRHASQVC